MISNGFIVLGVLSIFTVTSIIDAAKIKLTPHQPISKIAGESFAVNCQIEGGLSDEQRPRWIKIGKDGEEEAIPSSGRVFARNSRNNNASELLRIQIAEKSDAGVYKCLYGNEDASITVDISGKLVFIDTPNEQHPTVGNDSVITCRAAADEPPEIAWTRDGVPIDDDDRHTTSDDGDLFIKKFDPAKDNGIYKCDAIQKGMGEIVSIYINVTAYEPPDSVVINLVEKERWNKGVHEGAANVTLVCTANGVPSPDLDWTKDGTRLETDDRFYVLERGTLVIRKMSQEDAGTYHCEAKNKVGEQKNEYSITVYRKPQIAKIDATQSVLFGDDFLSVCQFDGEESLTAVWTRNGAKIVEKSLGDDEDGASGDGEKQSESFMVLKDHTATLHVKSATLDDAGEYTCTVSNDAGLVSDGLKLEVRKSPTLTSFTNGKVRAVVGSQHTIFCEALAVPDPEWKWSKGDAVITSVDGQHEILTGGRNSSLKVTPAMDDDFGNYTCTANNNVGQPASTIIELIKIAKPETPTVHCDEEGSKPTSLRLKIVAFSAQSPEHLRPNVVRIRINNGEIPESNQNIAHDGVYTLSGLEPSTTYVLSVDGENEAGSSEPVVAECQTSSPTRPGKPVFTQGGNFSCDVAECSIDWRVDDNGGLLIDSYTVSYAPKVNEGEPEPRRTEHRTSENRYVFNNLASATEYRVKVWATNSAGPGEEAEITVIADDELRQVGGETSDQFTTGPSTGAIVGIVIIILLIIVILVDVACYYVNQCGLLMCVCVNLCGKTPPGVKPKEILGEEGAIGTARETKFEEKQEKYSLRQEQSPLSMEKHDADANESTPMIETKVKHEQAVDS